MRPSLRFLALVAVGWVGVRAATLGKVPGAEIFSIQPSEAKPPPIAATQFPPIEPVEPAGSDYFAPPVDYRHMPQPWPVRFQAIPVPVYYPAQAARQTSFTPILPEPQPAFYAPIPPLEQWPLQQLATPAMAPRQSRVVLPSQSVPVPLAKRAFDRVQLSSWALLRGQQGAGIGPPSLASGGQLGGSQAGVRLSYNFTRQIAASFRASNDVGYRGGEVAGGVRIQPVGAIPLWFTAERRQRVGDGTGRNAFALFAEGGVYQRPMPWDFELDAYLQGGVVGFHSRDAFVDGALTFTRPVYRQFSAGLGVWGGAQPGVYRVDAGPRISMKVRDNVRVHFDWRQRLAGNAAPGSGPAITLAGDF